MVRAAASYGALRYKALERIPISNCVSISLQSVDLYKPISGLITAIRLLFKD